MYVREQLATNSESLARSSRLYTALMVCHRSKSTSARKQNLGYEYLDDFWANGHLDHPDEYSITGLEQFRIAGEHWATLAALTDMWIDIERAILTVYEQGQRRSRRVAGAVRSDDTGDMQITRQYRAGQRRRSDPSVSSRHPG